MIKIGKSVSNISFYSCQPKDKEELKELIKERISKEGSDCDLNDIDTSKITDMSYLFYDSNFNGDISKWNVSNVKTMENMFAYSKFNQDISKWKINVDCDTKRMFDNCSIKEEYKPKILQS